MSKTQEQGSALDMLVMLTEQVGGQSGCSQVTARGVGGKIGGGAEGERGGEQNTQGLSDNGKTSTLNKKGPTEGFVEELTFLNNCCAHCIGSRLQG